MSINRLYSGEYIRLCLPQKEDGCFMFHSQLLHVDSQSEADTAWIFIDVDQDKSKF